MNITIHRGTDQIGGCVTEYEYEGWKLFVDYGEQLPGATPSVNFEVEGLTRGDLSKSALLITHYHGDHIGKITELPKELPIFMGKTAKEIQTALSKHLSRVEAKYRNLDERLTTASTFTPGKQFEFGKFKVMPIVIDHSAFDAYAFRIETEGIKVFHTGDFRTHGFRSGKFPKVIEKFVGKVDYMVCEATNINRPTTNCQSEHDLQQEFEAAFRDNKYNIVYLSSTNIDRLFGLYHATLRAKRPFYVDAYQKKIMDIVAGRDEIWGKSELYKYKENREPIVLQYDKDNFRINDKFKDFLSKQGYVLIARAGELFDNLIAQIPAQDREIYLSMWDGYVDKSKGEAYSPKLAKSLGGEYRKLHTSGHCDIQGLEELIKMLHPNVIIPIHTDNPEKFREHFSTKNWNVTLLKDGETFNTNTL